MSLPPRRIVVIGPTSSGKSTLATRLARALGLPYVELDALHWREGWTEAPLDEFREAVGRATDGDGWVVAGNYRTVRDIVWLRAQLVVWLDLPLLVVLWRLITRSVRRWWTQELLWGKNRETLWVHFKLWSEESLIYWLFATYWRQKREYKEILATPEMLHLKVVKLTSVGEVGNWIETVERGRILSAAE
ncbi:P-loop containing nucleoside triphosphate hydrolase protein [Gonapodya prolifera JEL478]|uniref:p-loop containing nucleoside triphosphate hydrolase protein n=1 Tax=Gonapodya prolifera (strain JEL478) TaxID=1344416 RepID=A0A138ZX77_GONPJ|nr:P-loop containing nucleoside triphosphate hydrolase protein [Gonapodya prolifera JEL478]|eukprot:KXS09064.1 P-loop containing nucleoside triphosphate hydrolase protein [Gonapodya prolifera JEL478]